MNPQWNNITEKSQIETIVSASDSKPQIIFKHSTRCGISHSAMDNLEKGWDMIKNETDFHYLDLLNYRDISNYIASSLDVIHNSPQIIVLKNGKVSYVVTHQSIDTTRILENL